MDGLPQSVRLLAVADDTMVESAIVQLTRELAQIKIDACWWALPDVSKKIRQQEIDHSWQWAGAVGQLRNDRWHEFVAVQTDEGDVQGAMLYRFNTKSFSNAAEGAVHV